MAILGAAGNNSDKRKNANSTRLNPSDLPTADFESLGIAKQPNFVVADMHNTANGNTTLFETASEVVSNVPNFLQASILSAATQLYNIAPSLGNAFGGSYEQADIGEVIEGIDTDLGAYYKEHDGSVDTLGFILSSFVPGLGGIKVLNAGQKALRAAASEGRLGASMAEAYKLKSSLRDKYLRQAKDAVSNNSTPYALSEANLLKAMGAGVGQAILESTAFEVAVAATMFNAPLLKDQDLGDIASNIAFGGVVFGAVGGVVDAARATFSVKNFIKTNDPKNAPWTRHTDADEGATASDSLLHYYNQITDMPAIPKGLSSEREKFLRAGAQRTVTTLGQKVRISVRALAKGDEELTESLMNQIAISGPGAVLGDFLGTVNVTRLADISKAAKTANKIRDAIKKGDPKAIAKIKLIDLDMFANTKFVTTKQWGEDAGALTYGATVEKTELSDFLRSGEKIVVSPTLVTAGKDRSWTFTKPNVDLVDRFDIGATDLLTAKARQAWVSELPPLAQGQAIFNGDLAMLGKAYKEFANGGTSFRFYDKGNKPVSFSNADDLLVHIEKQVELVDETLRNSSKSGTFIKDPKAMEAELIKATGINFVVVNNLPANVVGSFRGSSGHTLIKINDKFLTSRDVGSLINTLKHEEGHSVFNVLLDIGGIPTSLRPAMNAELEKVSRLQRPDSWKQADDTGNYKYLKYANRSKNSASASHEMAADTFAYFSKYPERMAILAPNFFSTFGHLVRPLGKDVVAKYMTRSQTLSVTERASMLNVRRSYLEGTLSGNKTKDLLAAESFAEEYTLRLKAVGAIKADADTIPVWKTPQHTVTELDITSIKDLDGNIIEGIAVLKQRQREYQDNLDRIFVGLLGEKEASKYATITDAELLAASRLGGERSAITSASANYGTIASKLAQVGQATAALKRTYVKQTQEALEGPLFKLTENKAAAVEYAVLEARLRSIPEKYTLNEAGDAFVLTEVKRYNQMLKDGVEDAKPPTINTLDAPESIPIKHKETRALAKIHIELNGKTRAVQTELRSAQGVEHIADTDVFYPIPVDQNAYPYFATITDEAITGSGHTKTIYANTQRELDLMIDKVNGTTGIVVRTKAEAEAYFKSTGQFDFDKTIHDNRLDVMLKRKGVSAPYYVPTDPDKIVSNVLNWHKQKASNLAMDIVSTKYEQPFKSLKIMGETFTNLATSKVGNSSIRKHADAAVENPYMDLVKVGLDIKNTTDYPFWVSANRLLDDKLSGMFSRTTYIIENAKTSDDVLEINKVMKEYGYKGAAYDDSMALLANHTAPKAVVSKFVQKANAILSTVVLRLDALNAVNNAVGANVLLGAESLAVIRAINRGDEVAVGALAGLAKIKIPGTSKQMLSTKKLIANSVAKFGRDTPEMQFFRDNGFVTNISDQYKWTLDQLTVHGTEGAIELEAKIGGVTKRLTELADKGEQWTGNRLAEEFNRFVAADVMKQMTDIAVANKLMDAKTALSYINTFVNRTQGNYLASQRPVMFQGPIGQAIGLFQTYQFNLMQQLLRHVGEGAGKDSMTLLGLQGTIYGMNGMPAFHAINQYIIGNASGNKEHKDIYDLAYGAAGKEAGDWLMYGAASNFLLHPDAKLNLYVRGDINPRQVTVVPTNPADIPIYGASVKFFGNLFNTADGIIKGGKVSQVLLQGLEHNGISRPLAGLAQTLQGLTNPSYSSYSTTSRGNVIAANDLLNISNLGRMLGGKPLAEAIAVDQAFRLKAYTAKDQDRRNRLGQVVRSTMIAGGVPSQEEVDNFAYGYAASGGKQKEFNKWMVNQYNSANTSQVNELRTKMSSQYVQSMQLLMGGGELNDFNELNDLPKEL